MLDSCDRSAVSGRRGPAMLTLPGLLAREAPALRLQDMVESPVLASGNGRVATRAVARCSSWSAALPFTRPDP
jgi:hypothetical protein